MFQFFDQTNNQDLYTYPLCMNQNFLSVCTSIYNIIDNDPLIGKLARETDEMDAFGERRRERKHCNTQFRRKFKLR